MIGREGPTLLSLKTHDFMLEVSSRCADRFGPACQLKLNRMALDVAFIDHFG